MITTPAHHLSLRTCLFRYVLCLGSIMLSAGTTHAAPPDAGVTSPLPDSSDLETAAMEDPAFARFVDTELLAKALLTSDSRSVTDVALQVARAERVLLRSHELFRAEQLLLIAIDIARRNSDEAALQRIALAGRKLNLSAVTGRLKRVASQKPGASEQKAPVVALLETTPEELATAQQLDQLMTLAENTADVATLREIRLDVYLSIPTSSLRNGLLERLDGTIRSMDETPDPGAELLTNFVLRSTGAGDEAVTADVAISSLGMPARRLTQAQLNAQHSGNTAWEMAGTGYRRYGNIRFDRDGKVYLDGDYIGQATRKYNFARRAYTFEFWTRKGSHIVQSVDGTVWAKKHDRKIGLFSTETFGTLIKNLDPGTGTP